VSARALPGMLACALLLASLWAGPPALAQSGPAPQALLDAAWNAADWPTVLAILDTMGESEAVLPRKLRARLNHAWELLAAGECAQAHAQFERALGLLPGGPEAQRGLAWARQRCPQAVVTAPSPSAAPVATPTGSAPTAPATVGAGATPITPQPVSAPIRYTAQRGDTLYSLARRYGLTVAELQRANALADDTLLAGQVLVIPPPGSGASPTATHQPATSSGLVIHLVQPGETLYAVARRYGSTVLAIQAANGLSGNAIWAGQRLVIPPSSGAGANATRSHLVSRGDTLYSLAARYGVTVQAIQAANGLAGADITVGTLLVIP